MIEQTTDSMAVKTEAARQAAAERDKVLDPRASLLRPAGAVRYVCTGNGSRSLHPRQRRNPRLDEKM
jgi:hypothetical protein